MTLTSEIERRTLPTEFEVRSAGDGKVVIEGYAYRFRARSQNLGGFKETILEGAGKEAIERDDVRALVNHDANLILGRNRAGTLRLSEDSEGLAYEIDADERQSYVRDLIISMERGDVSQSSFGFRALDEDWSLDEDDFPLRAVRSLALFDVSPVTYPAYLTSESKVSTRALAHAATLVPEKRALWIPDPPPLPNAVALHLLRG
ncbi:HK97 family phage prohead protease [Catellatospora sichuanensis]|uniref:HK97 family phage prohead protease n=1 Tax=Catellatospora sichuanensis TaxID=1969805 RepID=UPI0016424A62|nr:HK97 family phage prohead protease [Catellatospora sichuanensis]